MEERKHLEAIRSLYEAHIQATEKFFSAMTFGESLGRSFMGRGAYSGSGLFMPFLESLEAAVAEAVSGPVTAGEAAEILEYMLIRKHVTNEHPVLMELEAVEQKGDPLIPLLEKEDAARLHDAYLARYKKFRMLPSQRKTLKALAERRK